MTNKEAFELGVHDGRNDYLAGETNTNIWPTACAITGSSSIRQQTASQKRLAREYESGWRSGYYGARDAAAHTEEA